MHPHGSLTGLSADPPRVAASLAYGLAPVFARKPEAKALFDTPPLRYT